ncbi:MAG TPA: SRPBCC domain-containing protein [Vicinamibacterales bacterium]
MTRLHYSIDIDAPRQRVWDVLWDDKTYPEWTSAFMEGSHAVSDWKEGSTVQFLGPNGDGMLAVIEKKIPNERMTFRHRAEIKGGKEQPAASWSGAIEDYTLKDTGKGTTLIVELDTADELQGDVREGVPEGAPAG